MNTRLILTINYFKKHRSLLLALITFCISLVAFTYFYFHGQENLSNYDAVARLNSSRKTIDSITPGVGQLGGVWLPFPQVLMIPFIWNNFLWHTGIAGYIVSGLSFIVGAVYLEKTVLLLTKNRKVSFLIWLMFVTNINILLLQSMAMSETFFIACLILVFFNLSVWIKTHDIFPYLKSAFFVMILTLTRYEGYFVFLGAFAVVSIESFLAFKRTGREKIEGMLLLFLTIAGFGIVLWCIYSALFYKDPLFWLHSYSGSSNSAILGGRAPVDEAFGILNPTLLESVSIYGGMIFWTNGILTVSLGALGMIMYFYEAMREQIEEKKLLLFLPAAIISITLFTLLVIGYYVGFIPHIEFPPVYLTGRSMREWSIYADNNIRYGMALLPCILLFASFIAARSKQFFMFFVIAVIVQVGAAFVSPQALQYPYTVSWRYPVNVDGPWFAKNYDGGKVLISSSRHEDFIFTTGLAYKTFIYEGTRQYWFDSLSNPSKYAKWVVYNDVISGDGITLHMTEKGAKVLRDKFTLVYNNQGFKVYKLKEAGI